MAELKPVYLIHGDDHGAVAERRAGLRALAERGDAGAAGAEVLEGEQATPAGAAAALAAMTLAVGRRVIVVDGVERWRAAEVERDLAPALAQMPPETTLALFAREDTRAKAPDALADAVRGAGGQVVTHATVKPWELARWTREQAARLGLMMDAAAAQALVTQVGERQQRLLRELEKLALERLGDPPAPAPSGAPGTPGPQAALSAAEIEDRAAHSAEVRAFGLADALLAADRSAATLAYLRLRAQGERLSGLLYLMSGRLRDGLAASLRLRSGASEAEVKRGLRMPARAAARFVAAAARSDPERLRAAIALLAELELDSRGGAPLQGSRSEFAGVSEDTQALRAIAAICG